MRETLHNKPIFSLFVWLQSVFKDISYMVDPQNKVQILDCDHVRSSLSIFSILSLDKNPNILFFSFIRSSVFVCYCLFRNTSSTSICSVYFFCLSLVFSAFYFSCCVSCLKPCFFQMHHHDVSKDILFCVYIYVFYIWMCLQHLAVTREYNSECMRRYSWTPDTVDHSHNTVCSPVHSG